MPDDADLVIVGNPTNPTSVLHSAATLRALVRPGRLLVVDEAFADCVPGEPEALSPAPGVVVVRSLTKTWGLAGLRVGYLLAEPATVATLRAVQPQWPVSAPALEACVACSAPDAVAAADAWARELATLRSHLHRLVGGPAGLVPAASFLLLRTERAAIWEPLRAKGFAVRRGDTFPGLGPHWIRVAVRDEPTSTTSPAPSRSAMTLLDDTDRRIAPLDAAAVAAARERQASLTKPRGVARRARGRVGAARRAGRANARRRCPSRPRSPSSPRITACTRRA